MFCKRSAGILLPISSLPSPYGIGSFGKEAYEFADFLKKSKQSFWQVLPLGQTGYGDSPYQSVSAFAGNPYFVDLDTLIEEDLLSHEDVSDISIQEHDDKVDYGKLYSKRYNILRKAFHAFMKKSESKEILKTFCDKNSNWLDDYSLFMALKDLFSGKTWNSWPSEIKSRQSKAISTYKTKLQDDILFYSFVQMKFYEQWTKLRKYINSIGIKIIGDIPIYVPMDSADVWSEPEFFELDENLEPTFVAGVPPDSFNADGQLWGNPLYNWTKMKNSSYSWWKKRIAAAEKLYDVVRFDHFRGLASFWSVPAKEKTARNGKWLKGPGVDFINAIKESSHDFPIIAEDLGYLTDDVKSLLEYSGFPGMKVLQFAFDSREPSDYLPHNYDKNCICYTGTHDNTTIASWFNEASKEDITFAKKYLALSETEGLNWGMIRGGMSSTAVLFIAPIQDFLNLGIETRLNTPGICDGKNWCWRLVNGQCNNKLAEKIADITSRYSR